MGGKAWGTGEGGQPGGRCCIRELGQLITLDYSSLRLTVSDVNLAISNVLITSSSSNILPVASLICLKILSSSS